MMMLFIFVCLAVSATVLFHCFTNNAHEMRFCHHSEHAIRYAISNSQRDDIIHEMECQGWRLILDHSFRRKQIVSHDAHTLFYDSVLYPGGNTLYCVYLESTCGLTVKFTTLSTNIQSALDEIADYLESNGYIDMYLNWYEVENPNNLTQAGKHDLRIAVKAIETKEGI